MVVDESDAGEATTYYFTLVLLLQYNLFYISSGLKYKKKSIHLLLRHAATIYIFLFLVYCVASSSSFEEQLVSKFSNDDKKVALLDASLCVYDASWLLLLMVTKRTQNWSDLLNHPRPF